MVARYRVWMALGLGLLTASLAPGCRSFTLPSDPNGSGGGGQGGDSPTAGNAGNAGMLTSASGSSGDAGATGEAGAEGETGGAGAGSGGNANGGTPAAGGSVGAGGGGSGPEFSGRDVDVGNFFTVKNSFPVSDDWTHVVPFVHDDAPHFVAYNDETGNVSFRRLEDGPTHSSLIWSDQWESEIKSFSHFTTSSGERLVLYNKDGVRRVVTFNHDLQGDTVLFENTLGMNFTHCASGLAPTGLPYLYWYQGDNGDVLVDMLNMDGTDDAGRFSGKIKQGFSALAAVDGRVLGFHLTNLDVLDLSVPGEGAPIYLSGLDEVEKAVAFELDDIPLVFGYSGLGNMQLIELAWTKTQARLQVIESFKVLDNARSVTGLRLPNDEELIFIHQNTVSEKWLQVIRITLKPTE